MSMFSSSDSLQKRALVQAKRALSKKSTNGRTLSHPNRSMKRRTGLAELWSHATSPPAGAADGGAAGALGGRGGGAEGMGAGGGARGAGAGGA
eukprot:CAMPEP_0196754660 /NCGR_PEP_ID=MMETSP1091-20130531/94713_1 /TAXON_ID=302021 /ORGANISM="Rhodomonas sp., Strain CCMP768" /LENGTH=92 /DNA_ID=CAMNT_0042102953 /DNA_START=80 /DNA_END=358 /DNA_ORIENTATION=+